MCIRDRDASSHGRSRCVAPEGRAGLLPIPRCPRQHDSVAHLQTSRVQAMAECSGPPQSARKDVLGTFYPNLEPVDSSTPRSAPLSRCTLLRHSSFVRAVCVDALVRICAGGDQQWLSLPRHNSHAASSKRIAVQSKAGPSARPPRRTRSGWQTVNHRELTADGQRLPCRTLISNMVVIYGIHSVSEALKSGARSFEYVGIARERHDQRVQRLIDDCRASGVQVRFLPREQLDRVANTNTHQGVIAVTSSKQYADVDTLLEQRHGEYSFLVVLDSVEDPHNLGALIRTADAAGADGVIIPERRAAGLTGTAVKASAGASEHLPIARVTNISRTLDELKERNVWTVGLDERGTQSYDEVDYNMHCAIVLGAEGKGMHSLVRGRCDFLVSIPMLGKVPSLNVSVAGGVVMYEVARQRRATLGADKAKPKRSGED